MLFLTTEKKYETEGLCVGDVVFSQPHADHEFWIANAITQKFYGREPHVKYVDYDAVGLCFKKIAQLAKDKDLEVHYPQIGAGLAHGD